MDLRFPPEEREGAAIPFSRCHEGDISPQEQAELDAAEERKRVIAAKEQRLKAECDAWIAALSLDERCAILGERANGIRMPDDVALRNYFRAEIWPKLQNGGAE